MLLLFSVRVAEGKELFIRFTVRVFVKLCRFSSSQDMVVIPAITKIIRIGVIHLKSFISYFVIISYFLIYCAMRLYRMGLPSNTANPLALLRLCFVAVFVNKHASLRILLLLQKL